MIHRIAKKERAEEQDFAGDEHPNTDRDAFALAVEIRPGFTQGGQRVTHEAPPCAKCTPGAPEINPGQPHLAP